MVLVMAPAKQGTCQITGECRQGTQKAKSASAAGVLHEGIVDLASCTRPLYQEPRQLQAGSLGVQRLSALDDALDCWSSCYDVSLQSFLCLRCAARRHNTNSILFLLKPPCSPPLLCEQDWHCVNFVAKTCLNNPPAQAWPHGLYSYPTLCPFPPPPRACLDRYGTTSTLSPSTIPTTPCPGALP